MKIDNVQYLTFKGKVELIGDAKVNDRILRPLIHQLKYNCGSKKVKHVIAYNNNAFLGVTSSFYNATLHNFFIRAYAICGGKYSKTEDAVKKLIDWSIGTKPWIEDIRKQESLLYKSNNKKGLIKKFLHFFKK